MLIRGVIHHELRDHAKVPGVCGSEQSTKVAQGAVRRVHLSVGRDVVPVVFQRRWIERQEPQGGDSQVPDVVQLALEPPEVADAVAVAVVVGADVDLVQHGVLVPARGADGERDGRLDRGSQTRFDHGPAPGLGVCASIGRGSTEKTWAGRSPGRSST